jgi:hypothetical protein
LLTNAEENLRRQLPDIFREVSIRLYETYRQTRNEQRLPAPAPAPATNLQNDQHIDVVNSDSNSGLETDSNSFDATVADLSQPLGLYDFASLNFDDSYLSSINSAFPPPGAGMDALLTQDWSFCGLPGSGMVEEQVIEES